MRDKIIFSLTILWVIAISVTATVLLAIPLFGLEIQWYQLANVAQMSAQTLWHNFLVLMDYLLNPFIAHLNMPDFPSSASGLKHFSEVKNLFMLALVLTIVLIPAFVIFIKENLRIVFHNGLRIVMIFPLALGIIAVLIGFDNFFIYFHEVLFRDNTWIFNPVVDPIINVLPEQYFMHTFLVFVIVYELIFFLLYQKGYSRIKKLNKR